MLAHHGARFKFKFMVLLVVLLVFF